MSGIVTQQPNHIALVDCNNFYVSCERLFRPDLAEKPVAVLSNNDGCIVSRSQEVKALGIKMAVPVHQVEHLIKQHNIQLFSSNYTLYADLSARVMHCLTAFSPRVDVYSIDEAFLDLDRWNLKILPLGQEIKYSIQRWVGIPVSVGIAPTKTLAKLANLAAKKWPKAGGVVDLSLPERRKKLMKLLAVSDVWGVGKQLSQQLNKHGIYTIWDLHQQPAERMNKLFNITLAHIVQELQGYPVIAFNKKIAAKKQIICSRSFKKRLNEKAELLEMLALFCLRAAEKLRAQNSVTGKLSIYIRSNPFDKKTYYEKSADYLLTSATQDSRDLVKIAKILLDKIYKKGPLYQKAGVTLGNIRPMIEHSHSHSQLDLFASSENTQPEKLMHAVDQINQRFPHAVTLATVGDKKWRMMEGLHNSARYTTDWNQLAKVIS